MVGTFKVVTLAASIEEKTVNLFQDTYFDSGVIHVEGANIHCWKNGGHGHQNYLQVVENSCNPGFVTMGQKLGKEKLMKYVRDFGFGSKSGIDLNGESTGLLFNTDNMGPVELATTSFGQGISVTPIAQVSAVSAAINGGFLYKPSIVSLMSESETNNVIFKRDKEVKRRVISDESSKLVRYALESVVANGSGRNAYIENYRVGGKTGTAQKVRDGHYEAGNYILSFMGFMPADDPKIVVYVAIDHPHGVVQYGGTTAAPVAKKVLEGAISLYNYPESKEGMEKEYVWYDVKYKRLGNVLGMSFDEAKKVLKDYHVLVSGDGDHVVYQSPSPDSYVKEGANVKLMLE